MRLLRRTLFGNPILRQHSRRLKPAEITTPAIQELVADMRYTLQKRKYGVGLAAPQLGRSVALTVIGIKPTPNRPDNPMINMVVINPQIVQGYGELKPMWEGCISLGSGPASPYAQAMRYEKIRLRYLDEQGEEHEEDFDGLLAHVLQHETDHLNGVLFVDRVADMKTMITMGEYRKRYLRRLPGAKTSSPQAAK